MKQPGIETISVATSRATTEEKKKTSVYNKLVRWGECADITYHFMIGKSGINDIGLGSSQLVSAWVNAVLASPTRWLVASWTAKNLSRKDFP